MMKRVLVGLLSLVTIGAGAQTAREVLDKTASRLEQSSGAEARFTLTSYEGKSEQSKTSGKIKMAGRKFCLATPEMLTWFDGTSQWTMMAGADEVNLQTPSDEDLARMNPYAFISLYKKDYKYRIRRNVVVGDKTTYEIKLMAEKKSADLTTIIVNIDMATFDPVCIRLKHANDWVRIGIGDLRLGVRHSADTFIFPVAKYPKTTIIDLR